MADRSVVYRLRAEIGQFKAQMAQASASTKKFADDATAATKQGEQFRRGLSGIADVGGRVGLVAAGGLAAATKAAIDWESAWAGVMKTTDGTASQMAALEGELRELARTMPATHQEIAATAEAAGQLGVAREDVADFTKTMIQLGETTDLTADAAATAVAQIANVMGTAPDDIDRMGAALVALGNDGASTESQILSMAQRISGAGAQIGLSEPEILAISNAVASVGIEAEAGGSAVSTAFTKMAMAVSSGGPKLEKFAEIAGTSTTEFQRLFKETPAEAFAAFTQGLDRINKSGGDVFGTLKEVGLSDIRVSQAMLSMAGAGDLLTKSLTLGNKAWSENSALLKEFDQRAGTTASQMQVAWNNVKDAGIDMGAAVLPVLSEAAERVSDLTGAFQALPGPVKSATSGLLGVTAVFGGGLWFTARAINGVAEMRQNIADLGTTAPRAATALKGLGIAAGALMGAAAVGQIIESIRDGADSAAPSVERLTKALLEVDYASFKEQVGGIDLGAILDTADTGAIERFSLKLEEAAGPIATFGRAMMGTFGDPTEQYDRAAQSLESLDSALSGLVAKGGPERARQAFDDLAASAKLTADEKAQFLDLLPQFQEGLQGAANSASLDADATRDTADATRELGNAAAGAAPLTEEMAEALKDGRDAAYESASSFVNLGDSLNDSKVSLGGWIAELEKNAQALRDFTKNAREAGKKGLDEGLVQSLQDAGEEGALRMQQLAGASEAEIKRANKAWRSGQRATDGYVDSVEDLLRKLLNLPPRTTVDVKVNGVESALSAMDGLRRAIQGKPIIQKVEVRRKYGPNATVGEPGGVGDLFGGSADGSTVPHGGPYEDRYPYLLAPGEEVISNRFGQADRHRPLLKAINAGLLADGGTAWYDGIPGLASGGTGKQGKPGKNYVSALDWNLDLGVTLKQWTAQLEKSRDALQDETDARVSLASELGNTVAEMFTSSLGKSSDIWSRGGSWADIFGTLDADTAGAGAYSANVSKLQALGLDDPGALNALLSQNDAASIANLAATATAETVAQFEQRYQIRAQAVGALNTQVVAAQTAAFAAEQAVTNAELVKVNAQLSYLNGIQKSAPAATGRAVGKSSKKGAGKAMAKARR